MLECRQPRELASLAGYNAAVCLTLLAAESPSTRVGTLTSGWRSHGAPSGRLISTAASADSSEAATRAGSARRAAVGCLVGLLAFAAAALSIGCSSCASQAGNSCRR